MLRVRIFAFAVACLLVAPYAHAQGNRGGSNGVPTRINNLQQIVDAVVAELEGVLGELPDDLAATLSDLASRLDTLTARVAALEAAGGGAATGPVIWSGGCNGSPAAGADDYIQYCANGVDNATTTVDGQFSVASDGTVTAAADGLYRISFWAVGEGYWENIQIRVGTNIIYDGIMTPVTDITAPPPPPGVLPPYAQRTHTASVVWRLAPGQMVGVYVADNGSVPFFAWAPAGGIAHSRLQVEYLGPVAP